MQVFFDLEETGSRGVEILIKVGHVFTEEQVHTLRDSLKLGDVVKASGQLEHAGSSILHLTSITVLERWRDSNPNRHFIPRCLSLGTKPLVPSSQQQAALNSREAATGCQEPGYQSTSAQDQSSYGDAGQQKCEEQSDGEKLPLPTQLCKFHINGRCGKGSNCPFLHVDVHAAPRVRQAWIADRYGAQAQFRNIISAQIPPLPLLSFTERNLFVMLFRAAASADTSDIDQGLLKLKLKQKTLSKIR